MFLNKINTTNDVKKLSLNEKKELANEIRNYLVDIVSENGGHLASNLGVVELTIALESVFDVTKDKIVWDVGHQCYTHKILNGRKEELKTVRKYNGISGFPKTSESITDCFNTGHSSTSISAAMGIAKARDIKNENKYVIAVIGDGALTGGMALEALNHVGSSKTKLIIVLNDNNMSISKNVGGINELLTHLRSKKKYRRSNDFGKNTISKIPFIGSRLAHAIRLMKLSIKQIIIPGMYFEEIGLKYLGPIDGHNIEELENVFNRSKNFKEPVIIHVLTKKGKGYKYSEESPDKYHGVGKFDKEVGITKDLKKMDYSAIFGNKLVELAEKNKKIVAITAAMKDGTGLSKFQERYPKRFFDVGIAEQHALTFAAGLAKEGIVPVVSIYSSFYQRAYDQIIHDICTQKLHVIMCIDRAGIVGSDGETHQGLYDLAFLRLVPQMVIMAPKNFKELEMMLDFSIKCTAPISIRYPRGTENIIECDKISPISLGKAEILKEGNDISIIAIGSEVSKAIELSKKLEERNYFSDVINVRFLKPLDETKILNSIKKTKKVITMENGTIIGGLSTAIDELIINNNLKNINKKSFAYPDNFIPHGTPKELEKKYGMDLDNIIEKSINLIEETK